MNAIYWGLTALCILDRKDALDRDELIKFVLSCWAFTMRAIRQVPLEHIQPMMPIFSPP